MTITIEIGTNLAVVLILLILVWGLIVTALKTMKRSEGEDVQA